MEILSLSFALLVVGVWATRVLVQNALARQLVLLGASAYFLVEYLKGLHPANYGQPLVALLVFVASGYLGYFLARRERERATRSLPFYAWLTVHFLFYLFFTKPGLFTPIVGQGLSERIIFVVGISYVFLRQLHVCFDVRNGLIREVPFIGYLVFLLSFHTLLAGPITRYKEFASEVVAGRPSLTVSEIVDALNRIATGCVKKFVVATVLYNALTVGHGSSALAKTEPNLWLAFHIFALYEYLDFSGYMDIMIGVGALMGVRIPENFNRPYLARNMIDFWSRWHITLANWIRDYVFNPMSVRLGRKFPRSILAVGVFCYVFAFSIVGLWHGIALGFFLWGLSQGLGLAAVKVYEQWLRKRLGRKGFKKYLQNRSIRWCAGILTVEYFVATVGLVLLDLSGAF